MTAGPSGGGYGLKISRFDDDLDPGVECHTEKEFWQLLVAIETMPAFLGGLEQFEDIASQSSRFPASAIALAAWISGLRRIRRQEVRSKAAATRLVGPTDEMPGEYWRAVQATLLATGTS